MTLELPLPDCRSKWWCSPRVRSEKSQAPGRHPQWRWIIWVIDLAVWGKPFGSCNSAFTGIQPGSSRFEWVGKLSELKRYQQNKVGHPLFSPSHVPRSLYSSFQVSFTIAQSRKHLKIKETKARRAQVICSGSFTTLMRDSGIWTLVWWLKGAFLNTSELFWSQDQRLLVCVCTNQRPNSSSWETAAECMPYIRD